MSYSDIKAFFNQAVVDMFISAIKFSFYNGCECGFQAANSDGKK